jgi:hypothetical protein
MIRRAHFAPNPPQRIRCRLFTARTSRGVTCPSALPVSWFGLLHRLSRVAVTSVPQQPLYHGKAILPAGMGWTQRRVWL